MGAVLIGGCGSVNSGGSDTAKAAVVVVEAIDADTKLGITVDALAVCGGVSGTISVAEGSVVLRDVPFGTGTPPNQPLTVSAPGYVTYAEPVQISTTQVTFVTVTLTKANTSLTGTVQGTITDSSTGLPITSALLKFTQTSAGSVTTIRAYTDSQGKYLCRGIPIGVVDVTAEATGYITGTATSLVVQDAGGGVSSDVNMQLLPGTTTITVSGTVVDVFTSVPLPGAVVTLAGLPSVTAGSLGQFTFSNVPVGSQLATATMTGYDDYSAQVDVLPGMGTLQLGMVSTSADPPTRPYNLQGIVTLNGRPDNAGAVVSAVDIASALELSQVTTPASGEYTMFLPPGDYRITVTYGASSLRRTITVPRGGRVLSGIDFILTIL